MREKIFSTEELGWAYIFTSYNTTHNEKLIHYIFFRSRRVFFLDFTITPSASSKESFIGLCSLDLRPRGLSFS